MTGCICEQNMLRRGLQYSHQQQHTCCSLNQPKRQPHLLLLCLRLQCLINLHLLQLLSSPLALSLLPGRQVSRHALLLRFVRGVFGEQGDNTRAGWCDSVVGLAVGGRQGRADY